MTQFEEGDIVTVKKRCSGTIPGEKYTIKNRTVNMTTVDQKGLELCSCKDNWILIKTTKQKFKIGDKVKYVSNHYADSVANPKWGGKEGKIGGKICDGATDDWGVDWDNGTHNSSYEDVDLELINPTKTKKGMNNLKAAAKALRKKGPKNWFEAEATIKIKIEAAGTETDAQEEILEEYDNNGMENLTNKQLIITRIQKI